MLFNSGNGLSGTSATEIFSASNGTYHAAATVQVAVAVVAVVVVAVVAVVVVAVAVASVTVAAA